MQVTLYLWCHEAGRKCSHCSFLFLWKSIRLGRPKAFSVETFLIPEAQRETRTYKFRSIKLVFSHLNACFFHHADEK